MELEGRIIQIIFSSDDTGFTVANMDTEDGEIIIQGLMHGLSVGDEVNLKGELVFHDRYGEQFKVEELKTSTPTSIGGIYAYLASGAIDSIGPKMAERIVDAFGEETFDIMESQPERLLEVRGIGKKTLKKIKISFEEKTEGRETIAYLQSFGISPNLANRIYGHYGKDTIPIIESNPYKLTDDLIGIGFKKADEIARKYDIALNDPFRLKAGLIYTLKEAARRDGHSALPKEKLLDEGARLLNGDRNYLSEILYKMVIKTEIHCDSDEEELCFLNTSYESENHLAHLIGKKILKGVEEIEADEDRLKGLGEEQIEAIEKILRSNIFVLAGGPGTGKTTLLKALLQIIHDADEKVLLCAPTGRAAKRMEESTSWPAATIHRLLGYNPKGHPQFEYDEDNPLDCNWLIIDEASMLDIELSENLLRATKEDTRVVFVGDTDQLPSVGPGYVLGDLIESGKVPVHKLKTVYRQAQESLIVLNAHSMQNNGKLYMNDPEKGFFFLETRNQEESLELIKSLLIDRLPRAYNISHNDIQVLSPMRKGASGVESINQHLQESLNPKTIDKNQIEIRGKVFREKDRIIQMKNNYDMDIILADGSYGQGIFNGDMGVIETIAEGEISVLFDDGAFCTYKEEEANDLELSYAITIHKSQGSEFPFVIIPIHPGPPMLYTRNLLYTAITRAKEQVLLIGDIETANIMINRDRAQARYTGLDERIRKSVIALQEIYG